VSSIRFSQSYDRRREQAITHTQAVHSRPSNKESSLQFKRTQQANAEDFILCGVVTAAFRVLSLFVVMTCYSYSKTESVTTDCSDDLLEISNKLTHQSKPVSLVTNIRDSVFLLTNNSQWACITQYKIILQSSDRHCLLCIWCFTHSHWNKHTSSLLTGGHPGNGHRPKLSPLTSYLSHKCS
jgi:hypothetical protein